jgi:hypothetical protein
MAVVWQFAGHKDVNSGKIQAAKQKLGENKILEPKKSVT